MTNWEEKLAGWHPNQPWTTPYKAVKQIHGNYSYMELNWSRAELLSYFLLRAIKKKTILARWKDEGLHPTTNYTPTDTTTHMEDKQFPLNERIMWSHSNENLKPVKFINSVPSRIHNIFIRMVDNSKNRQKSEDILKWGNKSQINY